MKTARFATMVQAKGAPENYLALADPAKDPAFQAALKAGRVMTVFQGNTGSRTDHGEVGYHAGHSRQFMIFPKSLKAYAGSRVVGIKYDLLDKGKEVVKSRKPARPKRRPKPAPPSKPRRSDKPPPAGRAKILPFPSENADEPEVKKLKQAIGQAMKLLEDGKAVAAFNLLKKAVGAG